MRSIQRSKRDASAEPSRLRGLGASVPALGAALLPRLTCPLCWPAYTAALGAIGLEFADYTPYLLPATAVFLGVAIASLALASLRTNRYLPLGLGLVSAGIVLAGKFAFDTEWATNGGIVLPIGAVFLSARRHASAPECEACDAPDARTRG